MSKILEFVNVVKKYGNLAAVNNVSFSCEQGICFGLLGPNGAGKTTAIEIAEDIINPSSGHILYKGKPRASSFREEVGMQFQQTEILSFLTVRETIRTFQSLYEKTEDLETLVELCHLKEIQNHYNDKISGGQRQRLLLAVALVNKPELLFLDEPSTGLDPQARRDLWNTVQQVKARGNTIILTTHYMEEAQYLCDEIVVMDYGKIIAQGSPDELIKKHCKGVTVSIPKNIINNVRFDPGLPFREVRDTIEIQPENINTCLETLLAHKIDLSNMKMRAPSLEEVFLNLTGRRLRQ
jgi:ABC-2 type transport system ATP-binding protein